MNAAAPVDIFAGEEHYDGPHDLERDSVIAVFKIMRTGQPHSHDQIEMRLRDTLGRKYMVNTVNKAFGILRAAGYPISKMQQDGTNGGFWVYQMTRTTDELPVWRGARPFAPAPAGDPPQRMRITAPSTPRASGATGLPWDLLTLRQKIDALRKTANDYQDIINGYPDGHPDKVKTIPVILEFRGELKRLEGLAEHYGQAGRG